MQRLIIWGIAGLVWAGCGEDSVSPPAAGDTRAARDAADDMAGDMAEPDVGPEVGAPPRHPLDDLLRVNHLQAKGTHNSYHVAPEGAEVPGPWGYTHAPLDVQLGEQGVRQLELDFYIEDDGTYRVVHIPFIDEETTCDTLEGCLGLVAAWSEANPGHHPLLLMIEPKSPQATADAFDEVEDRIVSAMGPERLLTPADVRGDAATLREAVTTTGWPTLGQARGRSLVVLMRDAATEAAYLAGHPAGEGRRVFMVAEPTQDHAAVVKRDNPDAADLAEVVAAGFVVRTRADSDSELDPARRDRAFAGGAHYVSTDYPAPVDWTDYVVEVPGGQPSRCNPVTAPDACTAAAIESLP